MKKCSRLTNMRYPTANTKSGCISIIDYFNNYGVMHCKLNVLTLGSY